MDERMQFVARRLAGEAMAELCREFGISRKTGYKIFDRYQACGVQGLTDRSRRPYRYANQLPFQVETTGPRLWRCAKCASAWSPSVRCCPTRRRRAVVRSLNGATMNCGLNWSSVVRNLPAL